jgi:hypothetical protein
MEKVVQVKLSIPLDDEGELEKEFWVDVTRSITMKTAIPQLAFNTQKSWSVC